MEQIVDGATAILQQYGAALVTVAGVLGAVIFIWQRAVVPTRRWATRMGQTVESLNELTTAQLTNNGGGSLLDKVDRIDPNHEEARGHWSALESALSELGAKVDGKFDTVNNELDRRKRLMVAVIHQLPEQQRAAITEIIESIDADGGAA